METKNKRFQEVFSLKIYYVTLTEYQIVWKIYIVKKKNKYFWKNSILLFDIVNQGR